MPQPVVLALLSHPDDETLGCGATLAAWADRGVVAHVVYAGDGVVTARGDVQDNRSDALAACKVLGLDEPTFLGYPDQRLDEVAVSDIVNEALAIGPPPDIVLTHAASDLNRDHQIVSHVARVLARPIGRPVALVECEVPGSSSWNGEAFAPNWFVDVTSTLERKLDALDCYSRERRAFPHPCSPEAVEALAVTMGAVSGLHRAEAFRVVRGHQGLAL